MRVRVVALFPELREQHQRIRIAQHALGHAGDGLLHALRVERLVGAHRAQHIAHRRLGAGVSHLCALDFALDRDLHGVASGERPERRQILELAALVVDEDRFAKFLQNLELLLGLQDEPLEHEGRVRPGPVELGHVHPELQLGHCDVFLHPALSAASFPIGFKITPCCKSRHRTFPAVCAI